MFISMIGQCPIPPVYDLLKKGLGYVQQIQQQRACGEMYFLSITISLPDQKSIGGKLLFVSLTLDSHKQTTPSGWIYNIRQIKGQ